MKTISIAAICMLLCSACVPSLFPLYSQQVLVYESALEGQWKDPDSDERWNFQRGSQNSYRLVISDAESWGTFEAHLVKLGEHYFLDLFPVEWESSLNEFQRAHLLPVHSFLAVRRFSPKLEMAAMKGNWLKDYLREHPQALRHEIIDEEVLLSAQPAELQAFLSAHLGEAFDDFGALSRPQ